MFYDRPCVSSNLAHGRLLFTLQRRGRSTQDNPDVRANDCRVMGLSPLVPVNTPRRTWFRGRLITDSPRSAVAAGHNQDTRWFLSNPREEISVSMNLYRWAIPFVACLTLSVSQALAVPVAYWQFGDSISDPNHLTLQPGDAMQPTASRTIIEADPDPLTPPSYIPGYDSTGNGNTLYAWVEGWAGHYYRKDVSSGTVGGSANQWSIQNGGSYPATFTWSQQSLPSGTDLQTIAPAQWTIEASVKPSSLNAWQTFVGREGNDVMTAEPRSAPLYFQITPQNHFRINYTDAAGNNHIADSTDTVLANQWYHVAAVSNGSTLSLYADSFDGTGYQLKATADLSASTNSAMINPGVDINGDTWGWTIGRGRYGTSDDPTADHTDRFFGFIDEVRISDNAIAPASLLFAGQNLNHGPRLEIDRSTGAATLVNLQASFTMASYNMTSAAGGLSTTGWVSISGNKDVNGNGSFDPNDDWTIEAATNTQLKETELDGDGAQLGSVSLGNAWFKSRYEDVAMTIDELLPDLSVRTVPIPVVFTGGIGQAAARSDLNMDGSVNISDWTIFKTNHLVSMTGLTDAQSWVIGDLDGDQDNDFSDFRLFQGDYDAANGIGAFAAMISAVPEPSAFLLLFAGLVPLGLRRS